jgi:hypothetical protein
MQSTDLQYNEMNFPLLLYFFWWQDFELLEISVLRQMLKQHFRKLSATGESSERGEIEDGTRRSAPSSGGGDPAIVRKMTIRNFDLERIIDDFVFM